MLPFLTGFLPAEIIFTSDAPSCICTPPFLSHPPLRCQPTPQQVVPSAPHSCHSGEAEIPQAARHTPCRQNFKTTGYSSRLKVPSLCIQSRPSKSCIFSKVFSICIHIQISVRLFMQIHLISAKTSKNHKSFLKGILFLSEIWYNGSNTFYYVKKGCLI